jgi:hypothetical protein
VSGILEPRRARTSTLEFQCHLSFASLNLLTPQRTTSWRFAASLLSVVRCTSGFWGAASRTFDTSARHVGLDTSARRDRFTVNIL